MTLDEFERLARVITQPLLLVALTGEILAANPAGTALCAACAPGRRFEDALADERSAATLLRTWSQHGTPVPARFRVRGADGPVELRAQVARVELVDGPAVLINAHRDPTAPFAQLNDRLHQLQREVRYRIAAERERAAALAAEQAAHARLVRIQRLTGALAAALDTDDVIEAILTHAAAAADVDAAVVAVREGESMELVAGAASPAYGVPASGPVLDDAHPLALAVRQTEPRYFTNPNELASALGDLPPGRGLFLAGVLPLVAGDHGPPLGALGLLCAGPRRLTPDERAVADLVALLCAQALERARLFDRERRFAETLQWALLPERLPELDNLDVAVAYLPASQDAAVGGDWYDILPLGAERVGMIVGDIAGHGPAAATAMAQARNALRALATHIVDPGETLSAFNDYLCGQLPEHMATAIYAVVDQVGTTLRYANAGHPPPLVRDTGGARYLSGALDPPAGVSPGHRYTTAAVPLEPRSRIVCYTDGLIERRDEPIDVGLRRLERAVAGGEGDVQVCCDGLVKRLVGEEALDDDAVALVADTAPAAPGEPRHG